jgi:hypothetical protein
VPLHIEATVPVAAPQVASAHAAGVDAAPAAVDDTADGAPDAASTASEELVRRAEMLMLRQQVELQDREARLDRFRSDFDFTQQQRAEFLREMNILRDMAMEQRKKDDEQIKKWIALI